MSVQVLTIKEDEEEQDRGDFLGQKRIFLWSEDFKLLR